MTLISGSIPNLLNGVSQQPMILRLPTQGAIQVNGYASVVEGLQKRPPCKHIAKLITGTPTNVFQHLINRDPTERYVVLIADGDIRVWDLNGVEKTVNYGSGAQAYLTGGTSFEATTVADYTFVVNRDKIVAMDPTLSTAASDEAVIVVDVGSPSTEYRILIDDVEVAAYETDATTATQSQTSNIAEQLYNDLVAALPTGYTFHLLSSYIYVKKNSGTLDIKIGDDLADRAMKLTRNSIQRFTDLPAIAKHGMKINVKGDASSSFDDYWVSFVANDASSTLDRGYWQETLAPGITYAFDNSTMPHVLVRESNGTFTFRKATEWLGREVGDEDSNINPSFVGNTINYVFFFRNRLGFLSDDNVVLSEASDFFNFFRTTVTALIDSDRIDVAAADERVSILRYAKPQDQSLIIFSDQQQFQLEGGATLSPLDTEMRATLFYTMDSDVEPEISGRSVFFAFENGDYAGIRQYSTQVDLDRPDAPEITEHVNKYIQGRVRRITAATHEDVLCVLASDDRQSIWVYKYYTQGVNSLQASWSKWTFCYPCEIIDCRFLIDTLYVTIQHDDGVYLESITVAASQTDDNAETLYHMDRRWDVPRTAAARSYNPVTDETTITLPYPVPELIGGEDCCNIIAVVRPCTDAEEVLSAAANTTTTTTTTTAAPNECLDAEVTRLRIKNYVDGLFGDITSQVTGPSDCASCGSFVGDSQSGRTLWDGTMPVQVGVRHWVAVEDTTDVDTLKMKMDATQETSIWNSTGVSGVSDTDHTFLIGIQCRGATGSPLRYFKTGSEGPCGVYTVDPSQGALTSFACNEPWPETIEIESY